MFSDTMSGDSRKDFILATTANYFAVQVTDGAIQSLCNAPALNSFLDDGNATVLAGRFEIKGGRAKGFTFSNKVCKSSAIKFLWFETVISKITVHINFEM